MYAGVIGWFFKDMLGIEPNETHPGFERLELHPSFIKDAGKVFGRFKTVRGTIELGWEYKDGHFEYTVTLPDGINATYNGAKLCEGKNKFIIKGEEK